MMEVQTVLLVLLMCAITMKAQGDSEGDIQFKQNTVTLTCPSGSANWESKISNNGNPTYTFTYNKPSKTYCETTGNKKYFFYVKGKGCDNCFELEGWLLGGAIVGDVVMTTILMTIIYKCTKKKTVDGQAQQSTTHPQHPGGRQRNQAFSSDTTYEKLNHQTRSIDIYSKVHQTG